jgi:hypothetical protein
MVIAAGSVFCKGTSRRRPRFYKVTTSVRIVTRHWHRYWVHAVALSETRSDRHAVSAESSRAGSMTCASVSTFKISAAMILDSIGFRAVFHAGFCIANPRREPALFAIATFRDTIGFTGSVSIGVSVKAVPVHAARLVTRRQVA